MKSKIYFLFLALLITSSQNLFSQCSSCNTTGCSPAASATGSCAFAQGDEAVASGNYSIAIGQETVASGVSSISIGASTTASAANSVAIGQNASANTANSVAIGEGTADGIKSYAIGPRILAYGDNSFAIGDLVYADEDFSYNYIFGRGATEIPSYFINNISNSMMFGMNSTLPTVFIEGASGTGWGKVGIGTTDPDGILHILEESAENTDFVIEKADTKEARIVFHNTSTEAAYISLDASENLMIKNKTSDKDIIFNVNDGGSDTEVMRVDGDVSRVGIGTTSPANKLEVSGGDINVASSTNGYKINNAYVLWHNNKSGCIFVGGASSSSSTGVNNTFVGFESGKVNTTGNRNNFIGTNSGLANTTGQYNTFEGYNTGSVNTTGQYNTSVGYNAGYYNATSSYNSNFGNQAGFNNTGSLNTFVGHYAGNANTSGSNNTAIGSLAGDSYTTCDYSTFVGYSADASSSYDNSTALGYNASVDGDNKVRVGNSSISSIGGYQNWTNISDARIKQNLQEDVPGVEFIKLLRPVTYNYDIHSANELTENSSNFSDSLGITEESDWSGKYDKEHIRYTGFIAQEVNEAAQQINYDFSGVDKPQEENGLWGLRYAEFVMPLVKAVQEQQAQIEELRELLNECCVSSSNKMDNEDSEKITNVDLRYSENVILYQNIPNPFGEETNISYFLPQSINSAVMVFYDNMGKVIKEVLLEHRGNASLKINSSELASGIYAYSIIVDGNVVDSKKMLRNK
jgi:hypothetical protein